MSGETTPSRDRARPFRQGAWLYIAIATLALGCGEGNDMRDPDGSPPALPLTLQPSQGNFGAVPIGQMSQPMVFTMTNVGSTTFEPLSLQVGGVNLTDFIVGGPGCGPSLAAGAACTFSVVFTPSAMGQRSAYLEVTVRRSKTWIPFEGTGAGIGDGGSVDGCRGPGRYEAGKEGSYRPCCPGLTEVFYQKAGHSGDGRRICDSPPLRVYACVQGTCGDGICEAGEAPACGCVTDCPGAAWEEPPDAGMSDAGDAAAEAGVDGAGGTVADAGADTGEISDSGDAAVDAP